MEKTFEEIVAIAQRAYDMKPETDAAFAKAKSPDATLEDHMALLGLMRKIYGEPMNDSQEDRQRILNALAAHAFGKIAEGEEVRIYDIRTDSMWFVGRKDWKLVWREDPKYADA